LTGIKKERGEVVPLGNKKILLVEDNSDDVMLIRRALQKANIVNELIVVGNGVEALNYFFGEDGTGGCPAADLPVVILLDINLPKINGFEVLRRMRAELKTRLVPIVALTSSNEEKDIVNCYRFGANSFIRKPVNFNEFIETIRLLGLYWLEINQPVLSGIRER
jgi:two-component system, response regulator